jgi:hypothetical protein
MRQEMLRRSVCLTICSILLTLVLASVAWGRDEASGRANSRGGLKLTLGSAQLIASNGTLPARARVTIRRLPSAFGSDSPGTFAFGVSRGDLHRPASLRLPLPTGYTHGSIVVLAYQGSHGAWYTVPARVAPNGRVAIARIKHLSTWTEIDLEAYILKRLEILLQPTAVASANSSCPDPDPLVSVSGAGALQVCVSKPGNSRANEQVTFINPTKTAFTVEACTGGLPALCFKPLIGNGYQSVLAPGGQYTLDYDALNATSTVRFTPNAGVTVTDNLVPVLGDLLTDGGTLLASVGPCIEKHNPSSWVAGAIDATGCLFELGLGPVNLGPIHFGGIGESAVEGVLKSAAAKLAQRQSLDSGGVTTLSSQQQLPPVGGGSTKPPPHEPEPPPLPPPAYYTYVVEGTCADGACGLHIRSGPGYSEYAVVGSLGEGAEVQIVCQGLGETVGPSPSKGTASDIWDKLTNGGWVSDLYISTPDTGTWSPPIPQC